MKLFLFLMLLKQLLFIRKDAEKKRYHYRQICSQKTLLSGASLKKMLSFFSKPNIRFLRGDSTVLSANPQHIAQL